MHGETKIQMKLSKRVYMQFRLTNSQRYLVVGLVGLVGLVLWFVPGLAFTKYRCEFVNLNCIFTSKRPLSYTCVVHEVDFVTYITDQPNNFRPARLRACYYSLGNGQIGYIR